MHTNNDAEYLNFGILQNKWKVLKLDDKYINNNEDLWQRC